MHIIVASCNPVKVAAVHEISNHYDLLKNACIESLDVASQVCHQPLSLQETVSGARNRAYQAYKIKNCDLSIGIESGIINFSEIPEHYFNTVICALYNGTEYFTGYSCGFPIPPQCMQLIIQKNITWAQAATQTGLIVSENAPRSLTMLDQDMILTHGLLSRKEHIKQAFIAALIPYTNPTWFAHSKQYSVSTLTKGIL